MRRIIDEGEHDIDILWQKMCQWYVDHRDKWDSEESFESIVDAFKEVLGRNRNDLAQEDALRWDKVKAALGNERFGGRGDLSYPSWDKFQHFIGGAALHYKYLANAVGHGVEFLDAAKRLFGELFPQYNERHWVGYDLHDFEWTWAGGAFYSKISSFSKAGIDKILQKFASGAIILSEVYTSISPNKDPDPSLQGKPHIDSADDNFPPILSFPLIAQAVHWQIERMEVRLEDHAK
ncbi:MAG: hypothetical protein LBD42_05460 [Desulfovibrio sp.]|nr:hypothetical protein [Desulfovibrio sp.]